MSHTHSYIYAATASAYRSIAIGSLAQATTGNSIAIGNEAVASGFNLGQNSAACIAIGSGAIATGAQGIAIGNGAVAAGDNTIPNGPNTIAIGAGAVASVANTIVLNAAGGQLVGATTNSIYVAPVRGVASSTPVLTYNTATKEITCE